jgi:hypothetical protein
VLLEQLRRARDVGEEERDGAAREILSHAELIIPPRQPTRLVRHSALDTRRYFALAGSSCRNLRIASFGITP